MSSLTGLSLRQVQMLWAVRDRQSRSFPANGRLLQAAFQASTLDGSGSTPSTQGLHQTAASLVRKGALTKVLKERPGRGGEVTYQITEHGKTLLNREVEVHGRPL